MGQQSGRALPEGLSEVSFHGKTEESFPSRGTPVGNTVIVFDWDDTLLCSTAVRQQSATKKQLLELEEAAASILRLAMTMGETLIVTNGNRTWVQDSARTCMPGLLPLLRQLPVVSARALYESSYPGDPFMWKHACFEDLFTVKRHYPSEPGINMVALGDQFPELDAAQHVTNLIGGSSTVKTVKLIAAPNVHELIGQLRACEQVLYLIASSKKKSDKFTLINSDSREDPVRSSAWSVQAEDQWLGDGFGSKLQSINGLSDVGLKDVVRMLF